MIAKSQIIAQLGESAVLLPDLIIAGLAANDRAKLRLTLLQEAAASALAPDRAAPDLSRDLHAAGLDDPAWRAAITGARTVGPGAIEIPGAEGLIAGLYTDLKAMIAPLSVADAAGADSFVKRLAALTAAAPTGSAPLSAATLSAMAAAGEGGPDSEHRLIMDLHKAINRLAEDTAPEAVDGARAHRLGPDDRLRLKAFMRGLNRTAPLAFGHPGLGTTAMGMGPRLVIQNDIGATDAHVIVIHVEAGEVSVTYTDVHRGRAKFFVSLFDGLAITWTPLAERPAVNLAEGGYTLLTGRYAAPDAQQLDAFLERLGSRLVFLIDWNKARKALQGFVGKAKATALLSRAAALDLGHRAFLELGGAELVLDAVRRVAGPRASYGARLDAVMGADHACDFLADVLRLASEGLTSGRSLRLLRDEIQAGLAGRLQSADGDVLRVTLQHLGLSRMLAGEIRDALDGGLAPAAARAALALRAGRLEEKGDRLTLKGRELADRLAKGNPGPRRVIDAAEEALDSLDEAAFLFSLLLDPGDAALARSLAALAEITVESAGQMVRACEAAGRAPDDQQQDATAALQAIDAVCAAERAADVAERRMIACLMQTAAPDARTPLVGMELAHAVERATDHMAHAALALRDQLLGDLAQ